MNEFIQEFDWKKTPIGDIKNWPDHLLTLVNVIRHSDVPFLILWGEEFIQIFNKSFEQLIGTEYVSLGTAAKKIWGDSWEETYMVLTRVLSDGKSVVTEPMPGRRQKYRKERSYMFSYSPILNKQKTADGILVTVTYTSNAATDNTGQKQFEETIKINEQHLRVAVEATGIGTFDWNMSNNSFQYSERLTKIFGYDDDVTGLTQKNFSDRIHPLDQKIRLEANELALQTGKLFYEARVVLPDNSIRWIKVNGTVFFDDAGKPASMYGTALDITNQKTSAERLEEVIELRTAALLKINNELKISEERYHKMIDEVQDYAIILLDKDGIIQNWNKGAEKIKLYKESEIVGKHFSIFYLEEDQKNKLPQLLMHQAAINGRAIHEGWRKRKNGTRFWGSIAITSLHDDYNNIIGYSKVTRDLTERKAAEDKLLQYTAELEIQNKELEQFAYVASHDLQEPLRKIRTFSEIIQNNIDDKDKVQRYFQKVDSSAQRMAELIKSVLNYSKLSKNLEEVTEVDLNQTLENVLNDFELLIEEKNATIHFEHLPKIKGVALQLNQLLSNLIGNALKFSEKKPEIFISSRVVEKAEIVNEPDYLADSQYLEISIQDNGIGFDQQYEKKIFSMFQRLHGKQQYAGTGIGLAVCKKIIENHNGFISAKSKSGAGSTFYVYLPVASTL